MQLPTKLFAMCCMEQHVMVLAAAFAIFPAMDLMLKSSMSLLIAPVRVSYNGSEI